MLERIIAGIDEVGRGPLAGPVVVACVHIPKNVIDMPWLGDVTDSKKTTKTKRGELEKLIKECCVYSIVEIAPAEIDQLNILQATLKAMSQAAFDLPLKPDYIYIDGNRLPKSLPCSAEAVVKGDSLVKEISCASIIAKVYRDNLMEQLGNEFPVYGWQKNSGYGTQHHLDAIEKYGITIHHRHSFAPVKNYKIAA
jgi:ribonuclease HII